ncbi:MAG: 16S rRNA processing protein RimM [Fimbriimonadaceae bacterium]|nr:16S rRNA processing protein RimM [Fimbriimonadaceae bacterium]
MSDLLRVGQIVSTHGRKGQVKVMLLTDFEDRLAKGKRLRLKEDWVTVESVGHHKERLILKLSGVETVDEAKLLQWEYLSVRGDEEPEMDEDEFLVSDLEGMTVRTVDGVELGVVDEVAAYPAQDILVIGELMIPLAKQFVKDIDLENEVITVELLEGMLDLETE